MRTRLRVAPFRVLAALTAAAALAPAGAEARDLFTSSISVDGAPFHAQGTNRARHIPELFDNDSLSAIDPGYAITDPVTGLIDLRGLAAELSYAGGSTALRFRVDAAGIDVSFDGGSRDASQEQFERWLLEGDGSGSATALLQAMVAYSPVDPVAGNPNSLESRMFGADYRMGTSGQFQSWAEGAAIPNLFRVDLGGGYYNADGWDVASIDVPLHFSFGVDRLALLVDVPVTFTSTQGAWTGMGSGALALRVAPLEWWALTPAVRIGGVGSIDLGGLAVMYSGSLTSHIRLPWGPFVFGIGNMGGVASTIDSVEIAGYSLAYDLTNWVTRNGGYIEGNLGSDWLGAGFGWRVFGSDVRFFGDDLYMDSYAEVGVGAGAGAVLLGLGLEVSYLFGQDYDGVSARLGLRF